MSAPSRMKLIVTFALIVKNMLDIAQNATLGSVADETNH
jgi:hypothetical protein